MKQHLYCAVIASQHHSAAPCESERGAGQGAPKGAPACTAGSLVGSKVLCAVKTPFRGEQSTALQTPAPPAPPGPEPGPRRPEALARGSVTPRCLLCPRRAQVGIQSDAGRFELACYRCVQVLKLWWFGSPFRTATAARTGHGYFTRSPWRASGVFLADSVQRFDRFRCDHPAETPNPADSLQAPRSAGRAG